VNKPANLVVYLARAGLGSRRACDELVRRGVVTVDGKVADFPRLKLNGDEVVAVDGVPVELRELRYVLVNKPRGVASTRRDPHAERVIVDLVPNGRTLFPVGRLDVDTTGLIILTNDGVLANHLMHPRYGVPKTYVARVRGKVSRRALGSLRQGLELDDGFTAPAEVNLKKQSAKTALVEITIHEGRKRQVRRMFEAVGLPVEELHRRRYGPLTDKGLEPGAMRDLGEEEVDALRRAGEEVVKEIESEVEGESIFLSAEGEGLETEPIKIFVTQLRSEQRGDADEPENSYSKHERESLPEAPTPLLTEVEPEDDGRWGEEESQSEGEVEPAPARCDDVSAVCAELSPSTSAERSAVEEPGAVEAAMPEHPEGHATADQPGGRRPSEVVAPGESSAATTAAAAGETAAAEPDGGEAA
jgi:23S rRNA pseudouridine2605 synthase